MITIYNKNSGEILRTCSCPENQINNQFNDEFESYISGSYSDDKWFISDGEPKSKGYCPSENHVFNYQEKSWVENNDVAINNCVSKRNKLLIESDWTQLPDVPLAMKQSWAVYRQALRDITAQESYPFNVIWPTKPE